MVLCFYMCSVCGIEKANENGSSTAVLYMYLDSNWRRRYRSWIKCCFISFFFFSFDSFLQHFVFVLTMCILLFKVWLHEKFPIATALQTHWFEFRCWSCLIDIGFSFGSWFWFIEQATNYFDANFRHSLHSRLVSNYLFQWQSSYNILSMSSTNDLDKRSQIHWKKYINILELWTDHEVILIEFYAQTAKLNWIFIFEFYDWFVSVYKWFCQVRSFYKE